MQKLSLLTIIPIVCLSWSNSQASQYQAGCRVTPNIEILHEPNKGIKPSNNLYRKPGSARYARGNFIIIKGKILDHECTPVENAIVQIWQTDNTGKYIEDYETTSEWQIKDPDYDENFAYSGASSTNNLGEFSFMTIFPAPHIDSPDGIVAPFINVKIMHDKFKYIDTRIYFKNHPRNAKDETLQDLSKDEQALVTSSSEKITLQNGNEVREYNVIFTLEGINNYRRY